MCVRQIRRRSGVRIATSGPTATHLLNGLYDAKLDYQPIVAIVTRTSRHAAKAQQGQKMDIPVMNS